MFNHPIRDRLRPQSVSSRLTVSLAYKPEIAAFATGMVPGFESSRGPNVHDHVLLYPGSARMSRGNRKNMNFFRMTVPHGPEGVRHGGPVRMSYRSSWRLCTGFSGLPGARWRPRDPVLSLTRPMAMVTSRKAAVEPTQKLTCHAEPIDGPSAEFDWPKDEPPSRPDSPARTRRR